METNDLILVTQFCSHQEVEVSFIDALHEFGLIEVVVAADHKYLPQNQLGDVEKMIRLHYELDINLEGIDVIANLLNRITDLQTELLAAKNKLKLYEEV